MPGTEGDSGLLPEVAGRPLFDPVPVCVGADFDETALAWLGKGVRQVLARYRVSQHLGAPLAEALHRYREALRRWARAQLDGQQQAFDAAAAASSALARLGWEARAGAGAVAVPEKAVASDLRRLQGWNRGSARSEEAK